MNIGFSQPSWLWLLLFLPVIGWIWQQSPSSFNRFRHWMILLVRLVVFISLILAMAGLEIRRPNDSVAVMFLLDRSESIPEKFREAMLGYIQTAVQNKKERDTAGIIVFGGDSSIEAMPAQKLDAKKIYSVINPQATDIASALRLAQASLPTESQRRMVLISDGNENMGDALLEAESARANGITVDVLPVDQPREMDIQVDKFLLPGQIKKGETFEARVHLNSTRESAARLRIFRNGRYLGDQDVQLRKGRNVFALPQTLDESGFHTYHVDVDQSTDEVPQNNRGTSFTFIRGDPQALVIHAHPSMGSALDLALTTSRIQIRSGGIHSLPENLAELVSYDLIILSNVNAGDLSETQMKQLESAVRDYGVGLLVIGGDDSFTAGGYRGSPLENILPVSMDLSSKKVLPSGALALVVHATEFQDGNRWARDIALAALEALAPTDQMGIILWDGNDRWLFPIQPVGDRKKLGNIISGMNPGDMPSFINVMQMAHKGLKETKSHLKHMIVFSDGDPQPPTAAEVSAITADKITVSTVMIGGHVAPDPMIMMASQGKGRFHDVRSPHQLPQIFIKEAAVILKSSIVEETFRPRPGDPSEILRGMDVAVMPPLQGYVSTTPKPRSETPLFTHQGDPLLSHWQYGLGRVVAFTSDALPKWGNSWISWDRWNAFWGQTAKWALRRVETSSYDASLVIQEGKGHIYVDALDASGKFMNQLNLQAIVNHPDNTNKELLLQQTQPGHYEAEFPLNSTGVYLANIRTLTNGVMSASQSVGAAIPYSPEFRDTHPNLHLLGKIADSTGGRILKPTDDIFNHQRVPAMRPTPVWAWLLGLSVILFPLDVGLRRVMIDREQWKEYFQKALAYLGWKRSTIEKKQSEEAMSALLARKARIREQQSQPIPPRHSPSILAPGSTPIQPPRPMSPPATETLSEPPSKTESKKPDADYTSQLLAAKKRAQQRKPPSEQG